MLLLRFNPTRFTTASSSRAVMGSRVFAGARTVSEAMAPRRM